jgi:Tol biopolymer transport system component
VQWYGNERLAYVKKHGEDGYWLMDLKGKAAGELPMPPDCDSFHHQCLSPNGKMIAFCGSYFEIDRKFADDDDRRAYLKRHPDDKQAHGIFVVDLAKQTVKQLLGESVANMPSWSPDSKYIACGIGGYQQDFPLAVIDVESGKVYRPNVKGTAADWSPDGKRLAITTDVVKGGSWLGGTPMDGAVGVLNVARFLKSSKASVVRISEPGSNIHVKEPYSWTMSDHMAPCGRRTENGSPIAVARPHKAPRVRRRFATKCGSSDPMARSRGKCSSTAPQNSRGPMIARSSG